MGCFSIPHSHRRKHKLSPSSSTSLAHPSLRILRELKLRNYPPPLRPLDTTITASSIESSFRRSTSVPLQDIVSGIRVRAALHNASSRLVKQCHSTAIAGSSYSSRAHQCECGEREVLDSSNINGIGIGNGTPIISHSAPIPSPHVEHEDINSHGHGLFPLPLPPEATSTSVTDDSSSQFVSSTGSGSSSSSCSSVPFPSCAVSSFSNNFKSYNNPLSSCPTPTENNGIRLKTPSSLTSSSPARPLPLPPAFDSAASLREFSYDELAGACLNFAPEFYIRDGGAGPVFKAIVRTNSDGGCTSETAVTRLIRGHTHSFKKWRAEVGSLARLSHPHVCKVLGFSREDPSAPSDKTAGPQRERLLAYEHTANGSLESWLYCRKDKAPLNWSTRLKIAQGAAQGLAFLHDRLPRQILYKCFKTLNIQVDQNFEAKLSDYGFARTSVSELPSCSPAHSLPLDDVYAAPETQISDQLSAKSNVWSFGIVLLELLTGRQNMDEFFPPDERNLLQWCRPYLLDPKRLYLVMDPELKGRYSTRTAKTVADIALLCLMEDPVARPSMRDVAVALSSHMPVCNDGAESKKLDLPFTMSNAHSIGTKHNSNSSKFKLSKSYNLVSVLATPGRSFTSKSYHQGPHHSPAHQSRTRFRGFLSGEITREASRSLALYQGDDAFLSRAGFFSGEILASNAGPPRSPFSKEAALQIF